MNVYAAALVAVAAAGSIVWGGVELVDEAQAWRFEQRCERLGGQVLDEPPAAASDQVCVAAGVDVDER